MLVYTTGHGVNGFTLNPAIGTFYLSHPNMQFSKDGNIYSINEGNYVHFPQGVKDYIKYCQLEEGDRPYTSRYIGSLVSDVHRNMIKGGIYIYPTSSKAPKGKLRLFYECNPMAFIAEQAGGKASDGFGQDYGNPAYGTAPTCSFFLRKLEYGRKSRRVYEQIQIRNYKKKKP